MSSQYFERPNGEVRGDDREIPEGDNRDCGYDYDSSMPGTPQSSLNKGYTDRQDIAGDTQSDKGFA